MSTNSSNSANVPFFLYKPGITVPEDVTHVRVDRSVMVIPTDAFLHRCKLNEAVLPDGLQEIGENAFYCCTSLERVNFPSTLTAIGRHAFYGCVSLREVELFGGIQRIGVGVFAGCKSFERINIPSTVTWIGASAFSNCSSLREAKLCGGIQLIGRSAFRGCCESGEQIVIPSKAFVIDQTRDFRYYYPDCRLVTDGTIRPANRGQVMIASECLKYMSLTSLAVVESDINAITNIHERTREENLEQIRALFAHYELERKKDVTTILELALWKANVDEFDNLNTRDESRLICGSGIIIPIVLPFL